MKNFHRTNPATPSSTPSPHPSSLWLKLDPRNHNDSMCYVGIAPGLCTHRPEEGQKGKRSVCLLLAAQLKETIKVAYKKKKKRWLELVYIRLQLQSHFGGRRGSGRFIWKYYIVQNLHFHLSCPSQHFSRPKMLWHATPWKDKVCRGVLLIVYLPTKLPYIFRAMYC